jgi:hypothetical protein
MTLQSWLVLGLLLATALQPFLRLALKSAVPRSAALDRPRAVTPVSLRTSARA